MRSGGSDPSDSTRDGQEIRGEEGQEGRERGGAPAGNPNPGVQGVLCDGKNKRKLLLFVTLLMSKNNSNFSFRTALASDEPHNGFPPDTCRDRSDIAVIA